MDCRVLEFSPEKSDDRIETASRVLGRQVLIRLLAFVLYLLGARRKEVADMVGMPEESLKTFIALVSRDGFPAFRDRRRADAPSASEAPAVGKARPAVRCEDGWCIVELGVELPPLRLPLADPVQVRTVLLAMLNAGWLSARETALALGISRPHCHYLAKRLQCEGVVESLVDKRQGQAQDYRVGPTEKAEIIRQFVARAVSGLSTSSEEVSEAMGKQGKGRLSPRTVRWHISKLGLAKLKGTLPELLETLKKNC
jgi:hypothetical protein